MYMIGQVNIRFGPVEFEGWLAQRARDWKSFSWKLLQLEQNYVTYVSIEATTAVCCQPQYIAIRIAIRRKISQYIVIRKFWQYPALHSMRGSAVIKIYNSVASTFRVMALGLRQVCILKQSCWEGASVSYGHISSSSLLSCTIKCVFSFIYLINCRTGILWWFEP